jgi:hypothetical protein
MGCHRVQQSGTCKKTPWVPAANTSRRRDTADEDTPDETPGDQDPGNEELDLIRQGVHPLNVSQRWPRPTPQPGPILADLPVAQRSTQLDTERCSGRRLRHAGVRRGVRRCVPANKSEDLTRSARANDHHRQGKQASRHKVRNIIEARRDLPETLVTIVATSHHCIHCVDCPIRKRTWCSAD